MISFGVGFQSAGITQAEVDALLADGCSESSPGLESLHRDRQLLRIEFEPDDSRYVLLPKDVREALDPGDGGPPKFTYGSVIP